MKKLFTIFAISFIFFSITFAKQIDENTAMSIGQHFLSNTTSSPSLKNTTNLVLAYKSSSYAINPLALFQAITYFYVFNASNGFVIVSGDDTVIPILGYSDEKNFNPINLCPSLTKWLESYKEQIRYAIENNILATQEIKDEWEILLNNKANNKNSPRTINTVNPLVQTQWDQPAPYNALCPGGSVTGCVATAMAQVMKYWNYPATGTGFHSFNSATYGTLSANYGSTSYQWSSMPNSITTANNAIATLMFHCGVSVDMSYSPQVSGAWVIEKSATPQANSEYAFKNYFGYKNTLIGKERKDYTDTEWKSLLKTDLDAKRPVLYDGFGNGGGHCFVCDGYDANDYFHFNWGWSGYYNGYFAISALNPGGTGTGGGTGGYNSGQQAVFGIEPPSGTNQSSTLKLYDYLTPSANTIYYGQSFDIHTNIINSSSTNFSGDYSAAVFDYDYNFIDFVQILTGWTLQAGYIYTSGITFSTTGLFSMLPGTYYIAVFYRPTGGNWTIVSNNGNYTNLTQIDVTNQNTIELYAPMTVTPGTTLTQGQSASVNLNVENTGSSTFYGTYSADLYDLSGNFVENIGSLTESKGLLSGYIYLSPFLTFTNPSLTAGAGTYLLATTFKPNGANWQLTGSTNYQNPIYVTVKEQSLSPDIYEQNNTVSQSFNLPLTFSGNVATKNTAGSNCHTGEDYDYYKINLAPGYNYTITARLHDSENSGNGNIYTLDAQVSYSKDGTNWSDSYDDIISNNISVINGGTVYFFVAPYFLGQTGTYLLDMTITRKVYVATKETQYANSVKVYPNPATDYIIIDLSEANQSFHRVQLLTSHGQNVLTIAPIQNLSAMKLPVGNLSEGLYFLELQTDKGLLTKKIIISK